VAQPFPSASSSGAPAAADTKGFTDTKYPTPNGVVPGTDKLDQFVRVRTRGAVGAFRLLSATDKAALLKQYNATTGHTGSTGTALPPQQLTAIPEVGTTPTNSKPTKPGTATLPFGLPEASATDNATGGATGSQTHSTAELARQLHGQRFTVSGRGRGSTSKRRAWSLDDDLAQRSSRVSISAGTGADVRLADDDVASEPDANDEFNDSEDDDGPDPDVECLREQVGALSASIAALHTDCVAGIQQVIRLLQSWQPPVPQQAVQTASKTGVQAATPAS